MNQSLQEKVVNNQEAIKRETQSVPVVTKPTITKDKGKALMGILSKLAKPSRPTPGPLKPAIIGESAKRVYKGPVKPIKLEF